MNKHFIEKGEITKQQISTEHTHSQLKNRSTFNPKSNSNQYIEVFKKMVEKEIKNIKQKQTNRMDRVWQGIKKQEKRKDIVVRPADKGGGSCCYNKTGLYAGIG